MLDDDDLVGTLSTLASVRCSFTNHEILGEEPQQDHSVEEVETFLNADPANAVVVTGFTEAEEDSVTSIDPMYVIRGASEALDNFYIGAIPAEDPNDADGGSWTAAEALAHVVN